MSICSDWSPIDVCFVGVGTCVSGSNGLDCVEISYAQQFDDVQGEHIMGLDGYICRPVVCSPCEGMTIATFLKPTAKYHYPFWDVRGRQHEDNYR